MNNFGVEKEDIENVVKEVTDGGMFMYGTSFDLNRSLCEGAERILQQVYLYDYCKPPYLPESYSRSIRSSKLSTYTYHWRNPSWLYWNCPESENILWDCSVQNGFVGEIQHGKSLVCKFDYVVRTDCSGFISGLFCYSSFVKKIEPTFIGFRPTEKVPLVSRIVDDGRFGYEVSLPEAQSGDILGHSKALCGGKDGHVMLIGAISRILNEEERKKYGGYDRIATVYSVGYPHSRDCRRKQIFKDFPMDRVKGVGCGYVGLVTNPQNPLILTFFGNLGQNAQAKPVKIFRPLERGKYGEYEQIMVYETPTQKAYLGLIKKEDRAHQWQSTDDGDSKKFRKVLQYRLYNTSNRKVVPNYKSWWSIDEDHGKEIFGRKDELIKVSGIGKKQETEDEGEIIEEIMNAMLQMGKKGKKKRSPSFSIGKFKGWKYSENLFNKPEDLKEFIVKMISHLVRKEEM